MILRKSQQMIIERYFMRLGGIYQRGRSQRHLGFGLLWQSCSFHFVNCGIGQDHGLRVEYVGIIKRMAKDVDVVSYVLQLMMRLVRLGCESIQRRLDMMGQRSLGAW